MSENHLYWYQSLNLSCDENNYSKKHCLDHPIYIKIENIASKLFSFAVDISVKLHFKNLSKLVNINIFQQTLQLFQFFIVDERILNPNFITK